MAGPRTVDVPLRCACGAFTGTAHAMTPAAGVRLVCYCDDCQCFAHHLERAGEILDAHGGTDLFQMWPARLTFDRAAEGLGAVRLSPKGPRRWHTACCHTPIANTLATSGWAFASVHHAVMDHRSVPRDAALGPVRSRLNARFAQGEPPAGAHPGAPFGAIARSLAYLALGRLRGQHRPSPFFDRGGHPVVEAVLLSKEARNDLRERAGFPRR